MDVTRRSVLSEALRYRETVMKQASVNGMGLRARIGMQETFARYQEECRILRELMQALEYEPVRVAIAEFLEREDDGETVRDWQQEIMDGNRQTGLFVVRSGRDGHTDGNGADYPEGRGIPAGKDFVLRAAEMDEKPLGGVEHADPGGGAGSQG